MPCCSSTLVEELRKYNALCPSDLQGKSFRSFIGEGCTELSPYGREISFVCSTVDYTREPNESGFQELILIGFNPPIMIDDDSECHTVKILHEEGSPVRIYFSWNVELVGYIGDEIRLELKT
ncbi:MAG: hypothetical protein WC477_01045 [Patescibacteria group bacterium]